MAVTKADQFPNLCIGTVTESGANTLTFKKIDTQISFNQKVAWILARIEYFVGALGAANFNGDGDILEYGLSVSSSFATAQLQEVTIVDYNSIQRLDYGTAAVEHSMQQPFVKDFSSLPGGGLIIPPSPLYLWAKGTGLVSASTAIARMYYTLLEMSTDQFWELVEARRVLVS